MIYNYEEAKNKYGSSYRINKAIKEGNLYKLEKNIYSDTKNVNYLEMISKKYPNAIFTMDSAFYFHNLTDVIPAFNNLYSISLTSCLSSVMIFIVNKSAILSPLFTILYH